jgi:dipeptidyl aminopeptidase/acylaminoacyl peptidase
MTRLTPNLKAPILALAALLFLATPSIANETESKKTFDPIEEKVRSLVSVGRCAFPTFSRDGRTLAFVSNMSGSEQIWTIPIAGGWPNQITSAEALVGATWSPTKDLIAFMAGTGTRQLYIVKSNGEKLKQLSDGDNQISCWNADGNKLFFSSYSRKDGLMEPYVADLTMNSVRPIGRDLKMMFVDDVTPKTEFALVSFWKGKDDNNLCLLNLVDGTQKQLTKNMENVTFTGGGINRSTPQLSSDGRSVYCVSNSIDDSNAFGKIDIGAEPTSNIQYLDIGKHSGQHCSGFCLTRDHKRAAVVWRGGTNKDSIDVVDLTTGMITSLPELPAEGCSEIEFAPDGQSIALTLSGSVVPSDVYLFHIKEAKYEKITHSPHPGIALDELVKPESVTFKSYDGHDVTAWLYRPKNGQKSNPFVIMFDGSGHSFDENVQALLSQGIGVLMPEIREASHVKDTAEIVSGVASKKEASDIKASFDYLVTFALGIPHRIGIMGFSHGGRVALVGLTKFPECFAAGVVHGGSVDSSRALKDSDPTRKKIFDLKIDNPDDKAKAMKNLSAIDDLDDVKAPILVQQGATDAQVPVSQAELLVAELKKRGKPVEYILFPDEGHWIHKLPNRVRLITSMVEFFDQHLKNP